ncbi:MAG: hypothetical protein BAA04_12745 [Firmicutes bacterium ZCTH02-B6]|nr:MAG: hypothetical protein BAA04_12745 [Firmicutes bacterium ZCTH02-B6]
MLLTTTDDLRAEYEVLGLVKGSRVRSRHVGQDLVAGLRKIVGGEITEYARLLEETREEAIQEMKAEARRLGANAIIGVRMATNSITTGAAEIVVYGTAIRIKG